MSKISIIDHAQQLSEEWRPGVTTKMHVSAQVGSSQLCIFEQWCEPGLGAPIHAHAVEEVLTVIAGKAQVEVNGVTSQLGDGQSVVIPAGIPHGFKNIGKTELNVRAILAAPIFEAAYDDARETPRRWLPPNLIC